MGSHELQAGRQPAEIHASGGLEYHYDGYHCWSLCIVVGSLTDDCNYCKSRLAEKDELEHLAISLTLEADVRDYT